MVGKIRNLDKLIFPSWFWNDFGHVVVTRTARERVPMTCTLSLLKSLKSLKFKKSFSQHDVSSQIDSNRYFCLLKTHF